MSADLGLLTSPASSAADAAAYDVGRRSASLKVTSSQCHEGAGFCLFGFVWFCCCCRLFCMVPSSKAPYKQHLPSKEPEQPPQPVDPPSKEPMQPPQPVDRDEEDSESPLFCSSCVWCCCCCRLFVLYGAFSGAEVGIARAGAVKQTGDSNCVRLVAFVFVFVCLVLLLLSVVCLFRGRGFAVAVGGASEGGRCKTGANLGQKKCCAMCPMTRAKQGAGR